MPQLPLRIHLTDYRRVSEDADAKGVTPLEQIQVVWQLGLAAAKAGWQPQEDRDRLVIAGAREAA